MYEISTHMLPKRACGFLCTGPHQTQTRTQPKSGHHLTIKTHIFEFNFAEYRVRSFTYMSTACSISDILINSSAV